MADGGLFSAWASMNHIISRTGFCFCTEARSRFYSVSVKFDGEVSDFSCLVLGRSGSFLFSFGVRYQDLWLVFFGAYAKRRCWYSRPDRYSPDLGNTQEESRTNNIITLSHLASTASCIVKIPPPSKKGFSFTISSQSPAISHRGRTNYFQC